MKKVIALKALSLVMVFCLVVSAHGSKYAGEFLNLGAGGRPLALGGSFMASNGSVISGYYNPAGLSYIETPEAVFMHSETFGSLLNHDFLAYSRPLSTDGTRSAFGVSLYRLGGGGIKVTAVDQNNRFYVLREESHADYAGYFSYSRSLGRKLSAGISAKIIYRSIIDETAFGIGIDLGALYSPAEWALFGISLRDATTTLLSYSTPKKEYIIPSVRIGSMLSKRFGSFGSSVFLDSETMFEGRDFSAQYSAGGISFDSHLGMEIDYREVLYGRFGSDAGDLTLGAGLVVKRFTIDIAMRDHSELDNTFLVSVRFGL